MSGGDKSHAKFAKSAKEVGSRVPRDRDGRAVAPRPSQGDDFNAEAQRSRGWEVRYGKSIFTENKRKNKALENNTILSLSYGRIIVKKSPDEGLVPAEYSGYQILSPGDIVIRCTDLQNDQKSQRVGIVEVEGIITSAYLGLKVNDGINSQYIAYWLKNWDATKEIYRYGSGLRQSLSWVDLKYLPIPLPPLPEQKEIVAYLDAETGRIDKAIAAEEKMIALLQERREIVINEAVGGGDFNAETQRRRGCEVRRLSQVILSLRTGLNPRRFFELNPDNATNYYVTIRELQNGKIAFSKDTDRINDQALSLCKNRSHLEKGDILFSGTGSIGEVALVREPPTNWNIKEGIYALKPNCNRIHTPYLVYVLDSPAFLSLARARAVGTAVRSIPMKDLAILPIPLPPLPEQEEIVKRLDEETGKIDRAIEVKRRQIELLRERRQIVIDEAVTGKVKVA